MTLNTWYTEMQKYRVAGLAGNDGSDLYFVQSTNRTGSYSTVLMHFTSAEASDPSDQQWQDFLSAHQSQLPQAEAAYGWALADVRGLKRVVVVPPEPPDYEFKCYEDPKTKEARLKMLDDYQKELFEKESAAIQRLLDAERGLTLFTGDDDSRTAETRAAVLELTRTAVFRKVDFLFRHYGGNPFDRLRRMAETKTAGRIGGTKSAVGPSA